MTEKILILDFGSQYTQLIARAVREANVYCEIIPYHHAVSFEPHLKGIILSGSPASVNDEKAPEVDIAKLNAHAPVLGICYGAQLTAKSFGGLVAKSNKREYGRAQLQRKKEDRIFNGMDLQSQVWMSHSDSIKTLPTGYELLADTDSIPVAAFKKIDSGHPLYGVQFHPEVYHSSQGKIFLKNFLVEICGCKQDWTPAHFITDTVDALRKQIGKRRVIMALSGGVDSTVAATLIHRAIGDQLTGIFVDNGVLRKDEFKAVLDTYQEIGLPVKGIDASERFYKNLAGKTDPEAKRKAIGALFIDVFQEEAAQLKNIELLGQGTIYPDVMAIRILGEVTAERVHLLQAADQVFIQALRDKGLYDAVWQAGVILLPVKSVGVMGDERTYEYTVALRAVTSVDGMTADWAHLPHEFLAHVSNEIINHVKGINRVVYDISSKPPATIEWE